jgi:flavin reductase (DIM6/NTAB) family NADH-FMN oxidoreductase RutF
LTVSAEDFRGVIGRFASGVTVITTARDGERFGTTASAVSSLSLEPPMVLICMNRSSSTGAAVADSGRFAINILGEGQEELARRFATKDPDKFAGADIEPGPHGQPLLAGALATIECDVVDEVSGGTHTVFLGEVRSAASVEGSPLAYFRGEFSRLREARGPAPPAQVAVEAAIDARAAIEIAAIEVALARDGEESAAAELRRLGDEEDFDEALVGLAGVPPLLDAYRALPLPRRVSAAAARDRTRIVAALAAGDPGAVRRAIRARADLLKVDFEGKE